MRIQEQAVASQKQYLHADVGATPVVETVGDHLVGVSHMAAELEIALVRVLALCRDNVGRLGIDPRAERDLQVSPNARDHPAAGVDSPVREADPPTLRWIAWSVVLGCHTGRPDAACRRAASSAIAAISPPK